MRAIGVGFMEMAGQSADGIASKRRRFQLSVSSFMSRFEGFI
jgi:hypothetical protein